MIATTSEKGLFGIDLNKPPPANRFVKANGREMRYFACKGQGWCRWWIEINRIWMRLGTRSTGRDTRWRTPSIRTSRTASAAMCTLTRTSPGSSTPPKPNQVSIDIIFERDWNMVRFLNSGIWLMLVDSSLVQVDLKWSYTVSFCWRFFFRRGLLYSGRARVGPQSWTVALARVRLHHVPLLQRTRKGPPARLRRYPGHVPVVQ